MLAQLDATCVRAGAGSILSLSFIGPATGVPNIDGPVAYPASARSQGSESSCTHVHLCVFDVCVRTPGGGVGKRQGGRVRDKEQGNGDAPLRQGQGQEQIK